MNTDFPPPSNGGGNNTGNWWQRENDLEHEKLERIEKDLYIEIFFNQIDEILYKLEIITCIDKDMAQIN